MKEIKTIRLSLPYKLGSVNCYLVQVTDGYILIDTGHSSTRAKLEKELGIELPLNLMTARTGKVFLEMLESELKG